MERQNQHCIIIGAIMRGGVQGHPKKGGVPFSVGIVATPPSRRISFSP
ncbi:MAG: hypothetical protein BECKG1743D_GA0114223_108662 [Candidatus Kentron sp. G]|nr:MAG: hypothetical protein BECKG1743D_GA0114223_108662 [Candidatus Kentron sp. G]